MVGIPHAQIDMSVSNHLNELPELTHAVKTLTVSHATRESLTAAWKQWVEEAGAPQRPRRGAWG